MSWFSLTRRIRASADLLRLLEFTQEFFRIQLWPWHPK